MIQVNAMGDTCPIPVVKTKNAIKELGEAGGVVENVDYGADVLLSVLIPEEDAKQFAAHLLDASAGRIEAVEAGESLRAAPLSR